MMLPLFVASRTEAGNHRPSLMASATSSSGNGFRTVASQALNGFVGGELIHHRGTAAQKEKRPPVGAHRAKAIRNWQIIS